MQGNLAPPIHVIARNIHFIHGFATETGLGSPLCGTNTLTAPLPSILVTRTSIFFGEVFKVRMVHGEVANNNVEVSRSSHIGVCRCETDQTKGYCRKS